MHNYCSVLSKDYIHRGLILYNSLKKYDQDFRYFFVCLNNEVKELLELMKLDNVILITMEQVEQQDQWLASVKSSRNSKEYSWTSKGSILLYLFKHYPMLDHLLWLDSDIVFYSNPGPIFDLLDKCSILLSKEGFTEKHMDQNNIYGIFNTGLMGFKNNPVAQKCLNIYRTKCIEWCYDVVEPGRWSDQMYLNYWPWMFDDIKVIEDIGINATAWNIQDKSVNSKEGEIYINENKLIFYHYSGFRFNSYNEYDLCCYTPLPENVINLLYVPYVNSYQTAIKTVNSFKNNFYNGMNYKELKYMNYYFSGSKIEKNNPTKNFCTITTNGYLLKCLALYESIEKHTNSNFHLWICTVDKAAYELLLEMSLPHATIVNVEEFENAALIEAKNNRYTNEYCWTIKASLIKYIFKRNKSIDSILYMDSDTYLFSDPSALFEGLSKNDMLLTPHNFTQGFYHLYEQKGKYNAGVVGFKNSKEAMRLLDWWESSCIRWCYNQVVPHKFADQKYLETIGDKYRKALKIDSLGINSAMWNINDRTVEKRGERIYINNDLLKIYHFSSFTIINENEFDLWHCEYSKPDLKVKEYIYIPYINSVKAAIEQVKKHESNVSIFMNHIASDEVFYNHILLI